MTKVFFLSQFQRFLAAYPPSRIYLKSDNQNHTIYNSLKMDLVFPSIQTLVPNQIICLKTHNCSCYIDNVVKVRVTGYPFGAVATALSEDPRTGEQNEWILLLEYDHHSSIN